MALATTASWGSGVASPGRSFSAGSPRTAACIDPSITQVAKARQQPLLQSVDFGNAEARALPFPDAAFDPAVMALLIFLVPEPAQGVAELARVVAPGGTVAA